MSFGLLSYFVPLLPLLRSPFPVLHSHLSQIISHVVFPSYVPKYIFSFLFLITRFGRLLSIRPAFNNWAFLAVLDFFPGRGCWPCAQPPTWRARVSLFVWLLPFDLSGLGGLTSSYATAGIALRVAEARKLPHHVKEETPSVENRRIKNIM